MGKEAIAWYKQLLLFPQYLSIILEKKMTFPCFKFFLLISVILNLPWSNREKRCINRLLRMGEVEIIFPCKIAYPGKENIFRSPLSAVMKIANCLMKSYQIFIGRVFERNEIKWILFDWLTAWLASLFAVCLCLSHGVCLCVCLARQLF